MSVYNRRYGEVLNEFEADPLIEGSLKEYCKEILKSGSRVLEMYGIKSTTLEARHGFTSKEVPYVTVILALRESIQGKISSEEIAKLCRSIVTPKNAINFSTTVKENKVTLNAMFEKDTLITEQIWFPTVRGVNGIINSVLKEVKHINEDRDPYKDLYPVNEADAQYQLSDNEQIQRITKILKDRIKKIPHCRVNKASYLEPASEDANRINIVINIDGLGESGQNELELVMKLKDMCKGYSLIKSTDFYKIPGNSEYEIRLDVVQNGDTKEYDKIVTAVVTYLKSITKYK